MSKNNIINRIAKIIFNNKLTLLRNKITPKKFLNYSSDLKLEKNNSKLQFEKVETILEKYSSEPKKLIKYIEGAKIAKTSLIFGVIYYGLIPCISTFLSSKMANKNCSEIKKSL